MTKTWATLALLTLVINEAAVADKVDSEGAAVSDTTICLISPIFGWNRDTLKMEMPGGRTAEQTETSPEYGLFFLLISPHLVVNDFLFYTNVNQANVLGNFLFTNYYGDPQANLTWNLGAGYLYHRIDTDPVEIDVHVPLVKAGPVVRLAGLHLFLNPYLGYAWERVRTTYGNRNNDSYLYGLSLAWRWRMLEAAAKYYYQDSQGMKENFQTLHARFVVGLTRHWGVMARYDYMEHSTTTDQSFLFGPVACF